MKLKRYLEAIVLALTLTVPTAQGGLIGLLNGTGTFSQDGGLRNPATSVDGDFAHGSGNGWAILNSGATSAQTAVWETAIDIVAPSGQNNALTFAMHFNHPNAGHALGRFRFSVTTDDRSLFADGLNSNGDVTANWSVLSDPKVSVPDGMTFSVLGDNSILTAGSVPSPTLYTLTYTTPIDVITGVRLEALADTSLPTDGPGHFSNGNFQLTEMTLDASAAVPEPATFTLLGIVVIGFAGYQRRRPRKKAS